MHITRMIIRVVGERPWIDYDSSQALDEMERALKKLLVDGGLEIEAMVSRRGAIAESW